MKFSDIPGHNQIKKDLHTLVDTGHVPHALMLSGPAGTGKLMLARAYAQYLHCESPEGGEPCGKCRNCRLHQELNHPDLHFVFPIVKNEKLKYLVSADRIEPWRRMITDYPTMPEEKWLELLEAGNSQISIFVNESEDIVYADSFPPYTSRYKIFLIWQPEKMRIEAANKLLKVLEEPSEGTIFILVSDNELQVLPTIFSRVQRFKVGRLSDQEIGEYLAAKFRLSPEDAARYAPLCNGSLIAADEYGDNDGENEQFLVLYQEVMRMAYAKKVAKLKDIAEQVAGFGREKIRRFLSYISRMVRENFIYNMKIASLTAMTPEEEQFSQRFSPFINYHNVEDFAAETDRARRDVERNANSRLVLFDYFLYCIILLHRKAT